MAKQLLRRIEHALGADALLERMPQKKVKDALGLSSMVDLATVVWMRRNLLLASSLLGPSRNFCLVPFSSVPSQRTQVPSLSCFRSVV